eukprot:7966814-Pyramimonas_sp.AAC.1
MNVTIGRTVYTLATEIRQTVRVLLFFEAHQLWLEVGAEFYYVVFAPVHVRRRIPLPRDRSRSRSPPSYTFIDSDSEDA